MVQRATRFDLARPVEFWLTDVRNSPHFKARTVNISSGGVLLETAEKIEPGRKIEMVVKMAKLDPESMAVDLRLLGRTVRSGDGWVAAQIKKYQILASSRAEGDSTPDPETEPAGCSERAGPAS